MPRVVKSLNVKPQDAYRFENIQKNITLIDDKEDFDLCEEIFEEDFEESHRDIENILSEAKIEAQNIIDKARSEASDIVDYARNQADDLKLKSREEGYNEGFKKGQKEGYDLGYNEGYTLSKDEATKEAFLKYDENLYELKTIIDAVSLEKQNFINENKDKLVRLALTVSEKVIDVSLSSSSEVIERMILKALDESKNNEKVKIYISDFQAELITKCDSDMLKRIEDMSSNVKIEVLKDAHIGTCVVELSDKIVDSSSKTLLNNIEETIFDNE